jgi:hypothetical protein
MWFGWVSGVETPIIGEASMPLPVSSRLINLIQIVIGCIIFFPWLVSTTPPMPLPYHQYTVSGRISRDSSGELRNYVAVLYGKRNRIDDSEFMRITYPMLIQKKVEDRFGLSDSSGSFFIVQSGRIMYDSLKVAIIAPDRPMILSEPFPAASNITDADVIYYSIDADCSCVTSPETSQDTIGYIYSVSPPQNIRLPY